MFYNLPGGIAFSAETNSVFKRPTAIKIKKLRELTLTQLDKINKLMLKILI